MKDKGARIMLLDSLGNDVQVTMTLIVDHLWNILSKSALPSVKLKTLDSIFTDLAFNCIYSINSRLLLFVTEHTANTYQQDVIVGSPKEVQLFVNAWNSHLQSEEGFSCELSRELSMLHVDKSPDLNPSVLDMLIREACSEDKTIIRLEWNQYALGIANAFQIDLEDQLENSVFIIEKDGQIHAFAVVDEVSLRDNNFAEITLNYTFECCAEPDKVVHYLLGGIVNHYFHKLGTFIRILSEDNKDLCVT